MISTAEKAQPPESRSAGSVSANGLREPGSPALRRGRRLVIQTWTLRRGLEALGATTLLLAPALGWAIAAWNSSGTALPDSVPGVTLLACAMIAIAIPTIGCAMVACRGARRHWPALWDSSAGLPSTVQTLVQVLDRGSPSAWQHAFLAQSSDLPLPGKPPGAAKSSWPRWAGASFGASFLLACWATLAPPRGGASPILGPQPSPAFDSQRLQELHATNAAATNEVIERAQQALEGGSPTGVQEAARQLDQEFEALRRELATRRDIAAGLESVVTLEPLARWLQQGGPLSLDTIPELSAETRALLRAAAQRAAELPDLAAALEQLARGALPEATTLRTTNDLQSLQLALQLVRAAGDPTQTAAARDSELATGGQDSPRTGGDGEGLTESEASENDPPAVELGPGTTVNHGERIAAEPQFSQAAAAQIERISTQPEIEASWLPVVEQYFELRARDAAKKEQP